MELGGLEPPDLLGAIQRRQDMRGRTGTRRACN
jgi:hypothetical protein